jgi:hypothetical protein
MRRIVLLLLATSACVVLASPAQAKGPSEGEVEGPGLASAIDLPGDEGSGPLGEVTEMSGFFPSVFRQTPDPMLKQRPEGRLGPRYIATYVVPGPNNELDVLEQHLYPYATPVPVSYLAPGQTVFGTEKTYGGWFVAGEALKTVLVEAGLPESAPTAGGGDDGSFPWPVAGTIAVLAAICAVGAALAVRFRRRSQTATA